MQLLVSVANPQEADAALRGGAHIIDAKDPTRGALGPVTLDAMRAITAVVGRGRPISAALGDARDEAEVEATAAAFVQAGAMFVKVGFGGTQPPEHVTRALAAAVRGARSRPGAQVIAVAYADASATHGADPWSVLRAAAATGVAGVLLDTADKGGPPLPQLMPIAALERWLERGRDAGLMRALAGRLTIGDVRRLAGVGADVIGVRGAACNGSRTGQVAAERVRDLVEAIGGHDVRLHGAG